METYEERPAYQQNDYVGWISRAKTADTRQKRFRQITTAVSDGTIAALSALEYISA